MFIGWVISVTPLLTIIDTFIDLYKPFLHLTLLLPGQPFMTMVRSDLPSTTGDKCSRLVYPVGSFLVIAGCYTSNHCLLTMSSWIYWFIVRYVIFDITMFDIFDTLNIVTRHVLLCVRHMIRVAFGSQLMPRVFETLTNPLAPRGFDACTLNWEPRLGVTWCYG